MAEKTIPEQQDEILEALLPDIVFTGWTWPAVEEAAARAGFTKDRAAAVFPGGLDQVVDCFSDWADRQMLLQLSELDIESMRIRDRIREAVQARLTLLQPHKEAVRLSLSYRATPLRGPKAGKAVWRTADRIWTWAGDTSQDYNYYTKRGLLSGVITTTTLAWLEDEDPGMAETAAFLDRRIENVLKIGGALGKVVRRVEGCIPGRKQQDTAQG